MKIKLLIPFLALALFGCATQSANLSTTQGQITANVDNAGTIAAGAVVVSSNTSTGTVIASINGTTLTLNPAAILTGTYPATFQNSVAVQLQNDIVAYTQTVSNTLQKYGPTLLADVGNLAKMTADVGTLLQEYGLVPVNASERTTVTNIVSIANKVATGEASLNSLLTGVSTTGTVPTTS